MLFIVLGIFGIYSFVKKNESTFYMIGYILTAFYCVFLIDIYFSPTVIRKSIDSISPWMTLQTIPFKTLKNLGFISIAGHIVLTMPIPILIYIILRASVKKISIISILAGIFIEPIQLLINLITGFPNYVIDIDDFKKINDIHGHPEGDYALRFISRCLRKTFRADDIIGRIGGDELLVYMRKINSPSIVHKKMKIFREQINEHSNQNIFLLTVSVGIVSYPEDGQSFEELYKRADQFMYNAKRNGKHKYCFEGQIYHFGALPDKDVEDETKK